MIFRRRPKELILWVVFLSFTESYKKILTIDSCILSSMLDHGYVTFVKFFRNLSCESIWIWLFYLFKDFLKELFLLIDWLNLFFLFLNLCMFYLVFNFLIIFSHELPTVFSYHMIIKRTIWILFQ